jgi:putative membrane protein
MPTSAASVPSRRLVVRAMKSAMPQPRAATMPSRTVSRSGALPADQRAVGLGEVGPRSWPADPRATRSEAQTRCRQQLRRRPSAADRAFASQAADGSFGKVASGELATERAGSPAVREFGRTMVQEHTRMNEELAAVASEKGVTPPTAPDPSRQAVSAQLS